MVGFDMQQLYNNNNNNNNNNYYYYYYYYYHYFFTFVLFKVIDSVGIGLELFLTCADILNIKHKLTEVLEQTY